MLRNVTAHARKSTGRFTVCAKARDFSVAAANYYTGARTVVRSWRARSVWCMKGVWCSGCHRPQINHGGAPEMGLIKGVGQEKGGAFPCKAILPIHNVITMGVGES